MYQIIKKPLVSEKNSMLQAENIYTFEVDRTADKIQIRKAVEQLFQVKVTNVRTSICRNRSKRAGKGFSKVRYWKKAHVKLAAGDKIAIFEGV